MYIYEQVCRYSRYLGRNTPATNKNKSKQLVFARVNMWSEDKIVKGLKSTNRWLFGEQTGDQPGVKQTYKHTNILVEVTATSELCLPHLYVRNWCSYLLNCCSEISSCSHFTPCYVTGKFSYVDMPFDAAVCRFLATS